MRNIINYKVINNIILEFIRGWGVDGWMVVLTRIIGISIFLTKLAQF
jgi:hypothetical protein